MFESPTIKPSFEKVHVILALFIFDENKDGIGRYRLQKELLIGSGTARSLIRKLNETINFITVLSDEKGHILTKIGLNFVKKLKKNSDFKIVGHVMSSQRLKSTFNSYFSQGQSRLNDLLSIKEQFDLEYSLSQVFSSKQKELFLKKLKGEKLTKTEKEYFSRVVKKKVVALANPELHRLSQKLLR